MYRYDYSLFILAPMISHETHKYTIAAHLPSPLMLCSLNFLVLQAWAPFFPHCALRRRILQLSVELFPLHLLVRTHMGISGECFSALISLSCPTGFPQTLMCCHQLTLIQPVTAPSGIC